MKEQSNITQRDNLDNYPITLRAPAPSWVENHHEDDKIDQTLDVYEGVRELVYEQQYYLVSDQYYLYKRLCKQPTNMAGIENCSNVLIDFNPEYQKLLLHSLLIRRNGAIIDKFSTADIHVLRREYQAERLVLNGFITLSIILDEVVADDIIEVAYTLVNHDHIEREFFNTYVPLAFSVPIHYLYLSVIAEGTTPLVSKTFGSQQVEFISDGERQTLKLIRKNIQTKKPLNYTPPWYRHYASIEIAVDKSWEEIARAYACYYTPQEVDRERCQALFADIEQRQPELRTIPTIILRYIQQSIRYLANFKATDAIVPSHPNETLNRGYGDCKDFVYLYISLLHVFGIKSSPVLVNSTYGRCVPELLPALGIFNHVICAVHLDTNTYYIDPTLRQTADSLDYLVALNFGYGLHCTAADPGLIELTERAIQDTVNIIETYEPTMQGVKGRFHTEITLRGRPALYLIHQLQVRPETEIWESIDKFYQKTLQIESTVHRVIHRDAIDKNEISYSVEYFGDIARLQVTDQGFNAGFILRELAEYFPVNIPDQVEDDLYLGNLIDCHYQVNFVSPKKSHFLCVAGEVQNEALSLKRSCRPTNNKIIIDTVLRKKKEVVSKQEYTTFQKDHERILDSLVINLNVQYKYTYWQVLYYLAGFLLLVIFVIVYVGQIPPS